MKNYDSICCFRSREESSDRRVCWEITTACNLKCSFCHRSNFENKFYDYLKKSILGDKGKYFLIILDNSIDRAVIF